MGGLVGSFIDVHEDSLNEGWGSFLRIWVCIDVSKPLLRGQMVTIGIDKISLGQDFGLSSFVCPVIPLHQSFPLLDNYHCKPTSVTYRENGKAIAELLPDACVSNSTGAYLIIPETNLEVTSDKPISPNYQNVIFGYFGGNPPAYAHVFPSPISVFLRVITTPIDSIISSSTVLLPRAEVGINPTASTFIPSFAENQMPSLFLKRQLVSSGGNVRQVLKRCRNRNTPLIDSTNTFQHQQLETIPELSNISLVADNIDASWRRLLLSLANHREYHT
uniref:Uncharacterized protein n=1 Tax=Cannabis sativa TaxID=3483 RepID=A0A803Q5Z3_CANSA